MKKRDDIDREALFGHLLILALGATTLATLIFIGG